MIGTDRGTGVVMMICYALFLLQFGCFLMELAIRSQHVRKKRILLLLLTMTLILILRKWKRQWISSGVPGAEGAVYLSEERMIPCLFLILVLITAGTAAAIWNTVRCYHTTLNRSAIKESAEHLQMGLCFSTADGFLLLANYKMEQLCMDLTGQYLQDSEVFWNMLQNQQPDINAEILMYESRPCFRLENQEIWTFERKVLQAGNMEIIQMTAVDVSELYKLSEALEKSNLQMRKLHRRLHRYEQNMDDYVKSREVLEAKMQIHKKMGQALLLSRAFLLQNDGKITSSEVLNKWKYVTMFLKKEIQMPEEPDEWGRLVNSATAAGVKIKVEGKLPIGSGRMELLALAAAEALTNAVRHAGADTLNVHLLYHPDNSLTAEFTNNGRQPQRKIIEGGGLGTLRVRIEEYGGMLQILSQPQFMLILDLPEKGGTDYDTCTGTDCRR